MQGLGVRCVMFFLSMIAIDVSHADWMEKFDYTAEIAPEIRWFTHRGLQHQPQFYSSIRFEPELYTQWNDENDSLLIKLFWRQDQRDNQRTHGDIRELAWTHVRDQWEFKAGISKVFWGVAETRHVVDIINQTDAVENFDGEDKLGQPMIRLSYTGDFGTIDLYSLPFFRERTFPGKEGRLRTQPRVDTDNPRYESHHGDKHLDWAARWYHTVGVWDIGLNFFRGTTREPGFLLQVIDNEPVLLPYYSIIQQYSTDVQATVGDWLFKFEGFIRRGQGPTFHALVGGFEYTKVGVYDSNIDLGWLLEFHHDNRQPLLTLTPYNNDVAGGIRIAFNDTQSTEILMFGLFDRHLSSRIWRLEASRRLFNNLKLVLEATRFSNIHALDPLSFFRKDTFFQLECIYFY